MWNRAGWRITDHQTSLFAIIGGGVVVEITITEAVVLRTDRPIAKNQGFQIFWKC